MPLQLLDFPAYRTLRQAEGLCGLGETAYITGLQHLDKGRLRAQGSDGSIEAQQVLVCLNAFVPRVGVQGSGTFPMELSASLTRPLSDEEFRAIGAVKPWGVLSTRPLGATVRLTPDRRVRRYPEAR